MADLKPIGFLRPFTKFCCTIGNLPSSYMISLTYEEQLLWLCNYLENTVIPAVNQNAGAVSELQELYVELKNYVDNYFNNLDVQNEIDTKLDEMAQDGTLEKIINQDLFASLNTKYTKAIISYDNVSEMINDLTIEKGQTIYVKGLLNLDDGFSAYYNIVENANENDNYVIKLNNNLYAVLQNKIEENYYNEIYFEKERVNNTDCYFVTIPLNDNNNQQINLFVTPAQKNPLTNHNFTPNEHARFYNTSFTSNASLSVEVDEQMIDGIVISNGTILRDYSLAGKITDEYKYIGIKEDRSISSYQANAVTAQAMVDDGVKNAVLTFGTCVENGQIVENFPHYTKPDTDLFLGVKDNKDIIILACDGRNASNLGLTYQIGGQLLIDKGCTTVFCLDSGGSSSVNLRGNKINMNDDDKGTTDRSISYLFDIVKTITNKSTADIYSEMGNYFQNYNTQLRQLINNREPFKLRSKYYIYSQTITPNPSTNGQPITAYQQSSPLSSIFSIENGIINVNIPEQYTSVLPYQVKIYGHVTIHNTTGSNTSHFLNIMENGNREIQYRKTIGNDNYITFSFADIMDNITSIHNYTININANNTNNTEVVGGNLYLEYIPNANAFIS